MKATLLRIAILFALVWLALSCPPRAIPAEPTASRGVGKAFLAEKKKLEKKLMRVVDSTFVRRAFSDPRCQIDSAILRWKCGTINFLDSASIAKGKAFLMSRKGLLDSLKSFFGPPPAIVTAIYWMETNFGTYIGEFKVFQTLFTRYFYAKSSKKKSEIVSQLACFLELAREESWDVFEVPSSWAGAFGLPQFMPCSYCYAVDWNGDGKIDLFNERDGLASIASFLSRHGWGKNSATHTQTLQQYNKGVYGRIVLRYAKLISR